MLYFNDNERFAADWLRSLWPEATVDDRSVTELSSEALQNYDRVHLFAGVGFWELALQLANWPSNYPVWTASLPCQPFSTAGKRKGTEDERHLWPVTYNLIRECRPPFIFGEQVASADVIGKVSGQPSKADQLAWVDGIRIDLEAEGYAFGCAVLPAASVNAPHKRERLYWAATLTLPEYSRQLSGRPEGLRGSESLGHDKGNGHTRSKGARGGWTGLEDTSEAVALGDSLSDRLQGSTTENLRRTRGREEGGEIGSPNSLLLGWQSFDIIECLDGKFRRIPSEPELFPLVNGGRDPYRIPVIKAAGGAIVPQVAAEFIGSFLDVLSASN